MSFAELLVVIIVALLAFGPKQIPGLAQKLGKLLGGARLFYERQRKELTEQMKLVELNNNIARAEAVEKRKLLQSDDKQS